ncbi:MAG: hypothetical protein KF881_14065, partial [Acidobacteria bacterium]|nr:hypothetical protein [Acidobacteriota bacterium]
GCIGCGSSGIFGIDDNSTMYVNGQRVSMTLDGARISYSSGMSLLYIGASAVCPNNDCGPRRYQGTWTSPLVAGADGFLGYFVGSSQQTNRPRKSKGKKPTLKRAPKRTKADDEKANALAATGIFDNELIGDFSNVDPPRSSEPREVFVQFHKLLLLFVNRLKTVGFTQEEELKVWNHLMSAMASPACTDLFRGAGLSTPAEVLRDRGMIVAHRRALKYADNNYRLGLSNDEREYYLNKIRLSSQGATIFERPGPVMVFLTESTFIGTPFPFREAVAHELIHTAEVGENYSWYQHIFWFIGHDLTGFPDYDKFIESCAPTEDM